MASRLKALPKRRNLMVCIFLQLDDYFFPFYFAAFLPFFLSIWFIVRKCVMLARVCLRDEREYLDGLENMEMENNERHVFSDDSLSIWRIYIRTAFEIKIRMPLCYFKTFGVYMYTLFSRSKIVVGHSKASRIQTLAQAQRKEKYKNLRWNQESTTAQQMDANISENCVVWYRDDTKKTKSEKKSRILHSYYPPALTICVSVYE